jgi:hypothetical protein
MEQLSLHLMNRLVFAVIMHGLNEAQTNLALNVLSDAVEHDNGQIRELAVVALADLSVPPAKRVPPLARALGDDNSRVRRRAARALGDQGAAAVGALPQLIRGLTDSDPSVRRDCAGAIGRLGGAGHPAAPHLIPLLTEPEYRSRAVASVAFKRIGRAGLPHLLHGVNSNDPQLRGRCATLLGLIAPDDERVVDTLRVVLSDNDDEVRARADEALHMVRTPPPAAA